MPSYHISPGEIAAVILAGGIGSRLGVYTWRRAKPAVAAGNTILASFSSSNAENSHIDKIAIAAQHLPRSLRRFYNDVYGSDFGPGRRVDMTDPTEFDRDATRYRGTADAFHKAMMITGSDKRKYVLGLSGDHIYSVNFQKMLDDISGYNPVPDFVIISQEVSREEAHRFGVLYTEGTRVVRFDEKPKALPGRRKKFDVNMGIYLATADVWNQVLKADREKLTFHEGRGIKDPTTQTEHDIGKDVIPDALRKGLNVHVYKFNGYWRDVGIPKALYDALIDIFIKKDPAIMDDPNWKIAALYEPQFRSNGDNYFTCGRFLSQKSSLQGSVLSSGVEIVSSEVIDSILMGGRSQETKVANASLRRVMADKEVIIGKSHLIATGDDNLIMIPKGTIIPSDVVVETGNNAIVAPLEDMVANAPNLIDFRKQVSPDVELYTADGRKVTFDELRSLARKD